MSDFAPTPGWERIVPRYLVVRAVSPPSRARYRDEKPFTTMGDNDCWQYCGDKPIAAGTEIESMSWPHSSFRPLNFSGQKVLAFYLGALRSRLPLSPWHEGAVRLDNGMSDAPQIFDVRPPQIRGVDMRGNAA
jgi:hypothetical protein